MVTVKRIFVFSTSVLSGIAVVFTVISLATEHWVYSDRVVITKDTNLVNTVKYGLFKGTFKLATSTINYEIIMTCLANKNICAVLCAKTGEDRKALLQDIYDGKPNLDQNEPSVCSPVTQKKTQYRFKENQTDNEPVVSDKFINFGVWISTVIFLAISILFGVISCILSIYNTVSNPIQVYLSIYGIFMTNGIALLSIIIVVVLWGVMFQTTLYHNIGIFYTLYNNKMSSDKTAVLGYSYWLNMIPIVFYISSVAVLFIRQYLVSRDPKQKIVQREEEIDPVIYLY